LELVGVFAVYLLAGEIGLGCSFYKRKRIPVWPAAGVALAAMLLFGYRIWPAVAMAAFIVNFLPASRISLRPESLWATRLVR